MRLLKLKLRPSVGKTLLPYRIYMSLLHMDIPGLLLRPLVKRMREVPKFAGMTRRIALQAHNVCL